MNGVRMVRVIVSLVAVIVGGCSSSPTCAGPDGACITIDVAAGGTGDFDQLTMFAGDVDPKTAPPMTPELLAGEPAPTAYQVTWMSDIFSGAMPQTPATSSFEEQHDRYEAYTAGTAAARGYRDGVVTGAGEAAIAWISDDPVEQAASIELETILHYELWGAPTSDPYQPQCLRLVTSTMTYFFVHPQDVDCDGNVDDE